MQPPAPKSCDPPDKLCRKHGDPGNMQRGHTYVASGTNFTDMVMATVFAADESWWRDFLLWRSPTDAPAGRGRFPAPPSGACPLSARHAASAVRNADTQTHTHRHRHTHTHTHTHARARAAAQAQSHTATHA